jgi:hypothetical protein
VPQNAGNPTSIHLLMVHLDCSLDRSYRTKATTIDGLADILYGSDLDLAVRDDTVTVQKLPTHFRDD